MVTFEEAQIALQIYIMCFQAISSLVLLITLIVFYSQLNTMKKQLDATREGTKAQNIFGLANFLQEEEVRKARRVVINDLKQKPYSTWTEKERENADTVCSSYTVAGIVVNLGLIPPDVFVKNWGPSIRKCYEILHPFLIEKQKPEEGGREYWSKFDWLYNQVISNTNFGDKV